MPPNHKQNLLPTPSLIPRRGNHRKPYPAVVSGLINHLTTMENPLDNQHNENFQPVNDAFWELVQACQEDNPIAIRNKAFKLDMAAYELWATYRTKLVENSEV